MKKRGGRIEKVWIKKSVDTLNLKFVCFPKNIFNLKAKASVEAGVIRMFSKNRPFGRFFHRVAMSVYIYMGLFPQNGNWP